MAEPPHLALPLRVTNLGQFATVEQDSVGEIAQNVSVILATPIGSRVEVPDFGSPRPEFVGPDLAGMAAAIDEWEPRASAQLSAQVLAGLPATDSLVAVKAYVSPHL